MLKKAVTVLKSRELITLIGVILLSILIWVLGPLIAVADYRPLENTFVRFVLILLSFVFWAVSLLHSRVRAKQKNDSLVAGLTAPAPESRGQASDELPVLKERFQEALALLKRSKLGGEAGRRYLYQLPWYILIGPPGAGKTTALVNSGLNFPLADQLGKNAVRGVGGTRNCDWWFTDQAVLIDTAGRYTTQDSDQLADSAAWKGFLDLLRSNRARQPINGVLLAISLLDLATLSESERIAHARAIKQRIGEIRDRLGVRVPVYVLFTKADLFAGFIEFFDDLGREDRYQVWGTTFPFEEGAEQGSAIGRFGGEFDALVGRLNERLLARLHQETDMQRRSLMFGFPQQVASLKPVAEDFLETIFRPSRLEETPLLRGVYFTSGTQLGTPIDRLMATMAARFGLGRQALSGFSGTGRSYFITRLLKDVVFAEAGIVSANRRVERRNLWIRRAAYAASVAVILVMAAAWLNSFYGNKALVDRVETAVAQYNDEIKGLPLGSFDDADLKRILPALATLRNIPTGYAERNNPVPIGVTFGLYQGDKLGFQAVDAYRRALNGLLLPRVMGQLERDLRANFARPDYLYEAFRVYLMLGRGGPLDPGLVKEWMALEWAHMFSDPADQSARDALEAHLDALLAMPLSEVPLDGGLVQQVRQVLLQVPLAARAYSLIAGGPTARQALEWNVLNNGGPQTDRVLARRSGRPLTEGVPGLFTYQGFYKVFMPQAMDIAGQVAKESWVLGPANEVKPSPQQIAKLERDVLSLYLTDYRGKWDALFSDLTLVPFRDLRHSVEVLNILSGPSSPMRNLLLAIARETTLSKPPAPEVPVASGAAAPGAVAQAQAAATTAACQSGTAGRLAALVGVDKEACELPRKEIDDHFKDLHDLVSGSPSELDRVITMLAAVYDQLSKMSMAPDQGQPMSGPGDAAAQLRAEAGRLPEPLRGWMEAVVRGNSTVTVGGARAHANAVWKSEVLPFCSKALDNRFPIVKSSSADVTLDDFSRLFAPGGLIDSFFDRELKPLVNTTEQPWKWQRVDNVDLGTSAGVLQEFQRAAAIRDSLFAGGAKTPNISFEITPVSLDTKSTQVVLSVDGQTVVYRHGPPVPARLKWPGPSGAAEARLAFSGAEQELAWLSSPSSITLTGPWSWFRLLNKATTTRSPLSNRVTITFALGEHNAIFELEANSVINPFGLDALERFRCPPSL